MWGWDCRLDDHHLGARAPHSRWGRGALAVVYGEREEVRAGLADDELADEGRRGEDRT